MNPQADPYDADIDNFERHKREWHEKFAVPHDDEIGWDAHDRIPKRDIEFTGGMPRGYCVGVVLLTIIGIIVAYFLQ